MKMNCKLYSVDRTKNTTREVIGIISYLPNDKRLRDIRLDKLTKLLLKICGLFANQTILIIAQNYNSDELQYILTRFRNNIIVEAFDKPLLITGARKELRRYFLEETDADYLIMLDDDCYVDGYSSDKYLSQIRENPDCFIEFAKSRLKLFAISRYCLDKVDFPNINPENEEGFEDRIWVAELRKQLPEKQRFFKDTGLVEYSKATRDEDSTWYKNQDISKMNERTINLTK